MTTRRGLALVLLLAGIAAGAWYALSRTLPPRHWLGYAEADYVKIAPTQQGRLVSLWVARGGQVAAGAPLFAQDDGDDRAARDQAAAELTQARERLADLRGRGREQEILQARADLDDRRAAQQRVERDLARSEALVPTGAVPRQTVEQQRADARSAEARVQAAAAKLALLREPSGRAHAIAAQQAAVAAAQAVLDQAQWRLDQRRVAAPEAGRIADTYAQPGETVGAGVPVVSLLPPGNIRVRFFVPETALARLRPGMRVGIACDSCPDGLDATLSFIATAPEYTPPVIYSQGTRGNLVYRVEARPDPARRPRLKPGQPVEVIPPSPVRAR